jgi:hypothetical protein
MQSTIVSPQRLSPLVEKLHPMTSQSSTLQQENHFTDHDTPTTSLTKITPHLPHNAQPHHSLRIALLDRQHPVTPSGISLPGHPPNLRRHELPASRSAGCL